MGVTKVHTGLHVTFALSFFRSAPCISLSPCYSRTLMHLKQGENVKPVKGQVSVLSLISGLSRKKWTPQNGSPQSKYFEVFGPPGPCTSE